MIPQICVPDLPEDASEFLTFLQSLNLFETAAISKEDTNRTKQYQEESKRIELKSNFTNIDDYLENLDMTAEIKLLDDYLIPRVAQLTQRSNQFNLRTKRYTESEILKISKSDNYFSFCITLKDKYGEYGLVSTVILEKQADSLFVDTWIISCRVLKRGVENFVLNKIVEFAKEKGFKKIIGEYISTSKNEIVKDLFNNFGFLENLGKWELYIKDFINKNTKIK